MMHRVLCCGGRDYSDYAYVEARLSELRDVLGDFAIIQGGARGADSLAARWGRESGLPVIGVSANWDYYDKSAGHIRNKWMLDVCFPTYVVAFPGGPGTANMVRQCEARGLTVWKHL